MPPAVTFADLREIEAHIDAHQGRVLVAHHFATWCTGCVDEMPLLVKLHAALVNDPDVAFVGVSWEMFMDDSPREEIARTVGDYAAASAIDFPVIVYTGAPDALIQGLGITSGTIPHTAVYGRDGAIALRVSAPLESEADLVSLRQAIEGAKARGR